MLRVMMLDEFMAQLPKGDLWIFGYGSLMWSPGFSYRQKALGRVHGYHRALCILSTRYRGTKRNSFINVHTRHGWFAEHVFNKSPYHSHARGATNEQYTIDLINLRRGEAGLGPLARNETLMAIARGRVADMVARG